MELLKWLIDTGANKNFIGYHVSTSLIPLSKPFPARTTTGNLIINQKVDEMFFKSVGIGSVIAFYVLFKQRTFDGIIWVHTLKALESIIEKKNNILTIKSGIVIILKEKSPFGLKNTRND